MSCTDESDLVDLVEVLGSHYFSDIVRFTDTPDMNEKLNNLSLSSNLPIERLRSSLKERFQ